MENELINPDDLLVIPDHYEVPTGCTQSYHKMKHLLSPSIVKSGGSRMYNEAFKYPKYADLTSEPTLTFTERIKEALGMVVNQAQKKFDFTGISNVKEETPPVFIRHVRIMNDKTGEFYPNRGATVMVRLEPWNGSFEFSFSSCHYKDLFNKRLGYDTCKSLMTDNKVFEICNYDPALSVLENIQIAIGTLLTTDDYTLQSIGRGVVLPELIGVFNPEQQQKLLGLYKLIRDRYIN